MQEGKTWYTSRTLWTAVIAVLGGISALISQYAGALPADAAPWVAKVLAIALLLLGLVGGVLRVLTNQPIAGTAAATPGLPPALQKGLDAFTKLLGQLPPDFGDTVFTLIQSAAVNNFKDNFARFEYVLKALQDRYPDLKAELTADVVKQFVNLYEQTNTASAGGGGK